MTKEIGDLSAEECAEFQYQQRRLRAKWDLEDHLEQQGWKALYGENDDRCT